MRTVLRLLTRLVSLIAHVSTWVIALGGLALLAVTTVLIATETRPIVVTTGSMAPVIPVRSVVLARQIPAADVKVGDIVTVPLPGNTNVTHRVIKTEDRGTFTELTLKGDANKTPDPTTYKLKSAWKLQTVMPAVGHLLLKVRDPIGLMTLGVLFGFSILTFISRVKTMRRQDDAVVLPDTNAATVVTLGPTPTEIEARTDELERQKGAFFSAVNQDLRTPLTSILGYLELLSEGDLGEISDAQRNALSAVQRNADRLHGLVGNMLTAAQIEGGELHPSLGIEVNADAILQTVHANFDVLARDRSIGLDLVIADELGTVQGSTDQIKTCVDHLVSNAIKFTDDGGRVTIRAFNDAGLLTVSVSDTGIGISRDYIDDLFTNFFRAPSADTNAVAGSGLGLAIVHAIVTAYDGSISVDSVPGIGSTFTIKFPTIERAQVLAGER